MYPTIQMLLTFFAVTTMLAPNALATLILTLKSGPAEIVLNDSGSPDTPRAVTYTDPAGGWGLTVTTGMAGTNPLINLSSIITPGHRDWDADPLLLTLRFTGLSLPYASGFRAEIGGTIADNQNLTFAAYIEREGRSTEIGDPLTFSGPPSTFYGWTYGGFVDANRRFSLTEVLRLTDLAAGTSSFSASVDPVPEPTAFQLLAVLLLAAVCVGRTHFNSRRTTA
jgi:hypothetical protein